jgi:hypothetical protein
LMDQAPPGGKMSQARGAAAAQSIAEKLRVKAENRKLHAKELSGRFAKASSKNVSRFNFTYKRSATNAQDASLKNLNYGITVQYLVEFTNHHDCWDLTTRQVRRRLESGKQAALLCAARWRGRQPLTG